MNYEMLVEKIRDAYEYADARKIFGHIAIQVNIMGEGHGVCYIEIADRAVCVEPYDYVDRDGTIYIDSKAVLELTDGEATIESLMEEKRLWYEGNEKKFKQLCEISIALRMPPYSVEDN